MNKDWSTQNTVSVLNSRGDGGERGLNVKQCWGSGVELSHPSDTPTQHKDKHRICKAPSFPAEGRWGFYGPHSTLSFLVPLVVTTGFLSSMCPLPVGCQESHLKQFLILHTFCEISSSFMVRLRPTWQRPSKIAGFSYLNVSYTSNSEC